MSDIFVSYKKDDRAIAERLVAALRATGKDVWWDDALTPHEAWDAMIERQIAAARVVIVLWSPRSVHSDWVRSEAHYAQDHHKMVPVMVEHCSIPLAFMLRQAVDLSDGRFDDSNPNWTKLLAWIGAVQAGDADAIPEGNPVPAPVAAAAAVPAKTSSGERWLGPAKGPKMWALAVVLVGLIAVGAFFAGGSMSFGKSAQPDVYVDAFTVAQDKDLPGSFSQAFADEMNAHLSAASRITPLDGDGQRHADAYQMSGNIRTGEGKYILVAKVFAPGITAPVLSPRIEVPLDEKTTAAKQLATNAAGMLRCIATASDSSGSQITVLPEKAIRPWAQYCQMVYGDTYDSATIQGYLKATVDAAPDFANGWSNLAEEMITNILQKPQDADRLRGEFRQTYEKALNIDPDNQKGLILKAIDLLGIAGRDGQPSLFVPLGNFPEFERLALRANNVRASDCGCEAIIYGQTLEMFGQVEDSLTYTRKVIANDPSNLRAQSRLAVALYSLGRKEEGRQALDMALKNWPDSKRLVQTTAALAVADRDWAKAAEFLGKAREFPSRNELIQLLTALKNGDTAGAEGAAKTTAAALNNSDFIPGITAMALAASGHDADLMPNVQRLVNRYGANNLDVAWLPGMQGLRSRPEFLELAKRANLFGYWRQPNHRPDVCEGSNPEAFCKLI
ncbi:toll/interleukin-1 receptor domain-containing protein [Sphingomonas jaspsi]|uniref:toll/interleukin-1 receptor domain-containing protein n=1 Tax=Sphingomonas jaspsi TaxID=392409 RepID=UPI0004B27E25|nr:TIR domain-containing protein [Sphingomonas jaspsi]